MAGFWLFFIISADLYPFYKKSKGLKVSITGGMTHPENFGPKGSTP